MKFKDRVFGANVEQPTIDIFNNLQNGSFDIEPLDEAKPTHQDYIGDRTTFARMWTAFLATGSLEDGSLFQKTLYHVVNSNEDKSYEANEPLQDRRFTELTENPYLKPTAGITSVSTKTEGALGAIKRTTVEFMVHNKKDFDDIFLPFFLKPGATVVVDYGWSTNSVSLYSVDDVIQSDDVFLEKLKTTIYGGTSNGEVPDEEFAGRADQNLKLFEIDPSLKGTSKDTRRAAWDGMRKRPSVVGFINEEENKGIVDTVVGRVITYNASVTEQGSFQCSLELVSENASLLDAEVTEDNSLKFLFNNKIEDLLVNLLSRGENTLNGTVNNSIFNSLSAESRARVTENFFNTLNLTSEINPDNELESNTVIPAKSLKAGIFYQSITDKKADSTKREVLYVAYGLFEDLFLNGIIAENQSKTRVSVNFNTEDTFVRFEPNLVKRQQQILLGDEDLPLFLLPDSWTDTYNGKTDASVVESQKNPTAIDDETPGTPIIPLREVFISAELISSAFTSKQNVNDALEDIIEKINSDSYGVFKLKMISLNGAFTSISFEDANLIPQPPDEPSEILTFDVTSGNSIVYSMDYKFEMPKGGLQNMIAIGQNDSMEFLDNAAKDNLNFLNILGPDRKLFGAQKLFFQALPLTKPKKTDAEIKAEEEANSNKDFAFKIPKNIIPEIKFNGDISTKFADLIEKEITPSNSSDDSTINETSNKPRVVKIERNTDFNGKKTLDCESDRDFYGKLAQLETVLSNKTTAVPPILPISISLTIYGNTYLNVGDTLLVNFLPDFYKENVFFQITNINHKLGSNWETTYDTVMRLRPDRKGLIVNSDEIAPRISQTRINTVVDQDGKDVEGVKNTIIDGEKINIRTRKGYTITKIRHRYDKQGVKISYDTKTSDVFVVHTTFPKPKTTHDIAMLLAFQHKVVERITGVENHMGQSVASMFGKKGKFFFTKDANFLTLPKESGYVTSDGGYLGLRILVEDLKDEVLGFNRNATQDAILQYFSEVIETGVSFMPANLRVLGGSEIKRERKRIQNAVYNFLKSEIGQNNVKSKAIKEFVNVVKESFDGKNANYKRQEAFERASAQDIVKINMEELTKSSIIGEPDYELGGLISDYAFVVPSDQNKFGDEDIFSYHIKIDKSPLGPITLWIPEWFLGTEHIESFVENLDDLYGAGKYTEKQLSEGKIGILSRVNDTLGNLFSQRYDTSKTREDYINEMQD